MKRVHFHRPLVSRRAFLGTAAGAGTVLGAGVFGAPGLARAGEHDDGENGRPNPIPAGLAPLRPFGVFIHHRPPTPGGVLGDIDDPSQITDFNGFVGFTRIRGGGTGTDTVTHETMDLAFSADMGFNQGVFIGDDGRRHMGTFGFVWLDLYTGPVGSANLTEQIHDYNPHIDANDVFWTVPVAHDAVDVDFDDAQARLRVRNLKLFDDHDIANSLTDGLGLSGDLGFPKIDPFAPRHATVSFDIEWSGLIDTAAIDNPTAGFKGSFLQTGATIMWSSSQDGFRFQSEDPDPSRNVIAIIGRERNGIFAV